MKNNTEPDEQTGFFTVDLLTNSDSSVFCVKISFRRGKKHYVTILHRQLRVYIKIPGIELSYPGICPWEIRDGNCSLLCSQIQDHGI